MNKPYCTRCGDVKACFHYPDGVVTRAYWHEVKLAEKRNGAKKR